MKQDDDSCRSQLYKDMLRDCPLSFGAGLKCCQCNLDILLFLQAVMTMTMIVILLLKSISFYELVSDISGQDNDLHQILPVSRSLIVNH